MYKVKEGDNKFLIKFFCFCKIVVKCNISVMQYVYIVIFLCYLIFNCYCDFVKYNVCNIYFCELCYFF